MKQKSMFHLNIGGATMLLIGTVFAITIFAVLSLRAALHEYHMAEQSRDSVLNYYEMDTKAEIIYASVIKKVKAAKDVSEAMEDYAKQNGMEYDDLSDQLIYQVDGKNACIQVRLFYDEIKNKVSIYSWKLLSHPMNYKTEDEEMWNGIVITE